MKLSNLKPARGSRKAKFRVGRGESSGVGKTSGRGGKGQTARSGSGRKVGFEGGQTPIYRRLPKRGFTSRQRVAGLNTPAIIKVGQLNRFDDGATVDMAMLVACGMVRKNSIGVKVLAGGDLTKKLSLKVNAVSASAKSALEKAGATIEVLAA